MHGYNTDTGPDTLTVTLNVDDGTGVVECFKYLSVSDPFNPVESIIIGNFVHIKGVLLVVNR